MKKLIILSLLLFQPAALKAGALDSLCLLLEGIPLPFCSYTRYHTCNSGNRQRCVYKRVAATIKKIDDPTTGQCAANNIACTRSCTSGPDGTTCSEHCVCNEPLPVVTQCRTQCNKCAVDGTVVDLGIECPQFCGDPGHCSSSYGDLELVGPEVGTCSAAQLCGPGSVDIGGPKSISECSFPPPPSDTPDYTGCCYAGGAGAEPNTNNLPPCGS